MFLSWLSSLLQRSFMHYHVLSQFYMLLVGYSSYSLCYALPYQDQANTVSYVTMCFSDIWILTSTMQFQLKFPWFISLMLS